MQFKVLSHAGLLVTSANGKKLVCDPWLVGSSYWRSWWNYPPVSREAITNLQPDVIYLTHIHWDHFHGPSLELFDKNTRIVVPKGNYSRNKDDLRTLGFKNVIELKHGESYHIDTDFDIYSYQFGVFLDSAVLIDCDGQKLLNLNDSKHMGGTLKQIVSNHKPIDFVFRSHSSANSRMSYELIDKPGEIEDDIDRYVQDFANTAKAVGARYAIPFASNHCHLHKDSWKYNPLVQTPVMVQNYFKKHQISQPNLVVMVSGDSYEANDDRFDLNPTDWFTNRQQHLEQYLADNSEKLNQFYQEEEDTKINKKVVDKYFGNLAAKIPFFFKNRLKNTAFTYILGNGDHVGYVFNINVATGEVTQIPSETELNFQDFPIQIRTTTFIFKRCIAFRIFSHMSIGKRVFYELHSKDKGKMELLNLIFNLDEYDMLPLNRLFTQRSLETWRLRWREIGLYLSLLKDKIIYRKLDFSKYLKPIR